MSLPWVEKYRPKILDDIVGNEDAINQFKTISNDGNIPHMILSGSPGTGKTTSILCLAKKLLGDEFNNAFQELNASDERGIDVIRTKITMFCKKKIVLPEGRHKIIFLDEVDSMTSTAQQALRRIIELYTNTTRFVMACNVSSKIIEAIQSRCSVIRFSHISDDSMKKRLIEICNYENVEYDDDGLNLLILCSNGDMRKAINNLQSVYITFGKITEKNVNSIIDKPDELLLKKILIHCFNNKFDDANEILFDLIIKGYSSLDIIQSFFNIIKDYDIDQNIKLKILSELGMTQVNLINGADSYLQLLAFIARIILIKDS
jgi:replication factor C subunit 2/4